MTHWYTADTHFGHENVILFCGRPFRHATQMDDVLLENLHSRVGVEDDLWILGDFAFGPNAKDPEYLNMLFGQLPGARNHLIVGNHDLKPTLALPWESVSHLAEVRDGPKKQAHTLCHYPMITWNHARRGALQMFGYVHNKWYGSRNSVNVGVDLWGFMPITFKDVAQRPKTLFVNTHWSDVEPGLELS
ncbi:MAG: metallophosphoesterase [Rhodobacteraceae bacterium]|nr:MAG: metallophosphoesterase [Paracoccaceae bacterium]